MRIPAVLFHEINQLNVLIVGLLTGRKDRL